MSKEVLAAGAVLWRPGGDVDAEVAVVHRPHYDDWSLPKGKLDDGETLAAAAVREVGEETGFGCVLGPRLDTVRYPLPSTGNTKTVSYFAARATRGRFAANDEVDTLRWHSIEDAKSAVSYQLDRRVLSGFAALPPVAATVLLVRHAKAGSRSDWSGDDDLRPLSCAGHSQARALRGELALWGARTVHAAPRVRCVDTVAPLATDLGVDIVTEPALSEEGYWPAPTAGVRRLLAIADTAAATGAPVAVCSQGGVIPDLVKRLAAASGLEPGKVASKKGSVWVLSLCRTDSALTLAAADYIPSPLPVARPS